MIRLLVLLAFCVPLAQALSTTSSSSPSLRVALPGLSAERFRHRTDRDLTELVQRLPGQQLLVEQGLRRALPLIEQGVRLDLLATAVRVSPDQFPDLYDLLREACQVLDLVSNDDDDDAVLPDLYVQSNPQANAYTLAWQSPNQSPIIVVTSALLEQCTGPEIQAVLGHELGHVKCEHALYLTAGGVAATPLRQLPVVGASIDDQLQQWRLAAEYTCDRAALLVAQDVQVVASALLKLFAGTGRSSQYSQVNVQAFLDQCAQYETQMEQANPWVRRALQQQLKQRTHPLPIRRVAALQSWAESDDYARILLKGTPMIVNDDNEAKSSDE